MHAIDRKMCKKFKARKSKNDVEREIFVNLSRKLKEGGGTFMSLKT